MIYDAKKMFLDIVTKHFFLERFFLKYFFLIERILLRRKKNVLSLSRKKIME